MSVGGVNNIEKEPLRRASKGELDEVEGGGGGGGSYSAESPIVIENETIKLQIGEGLKRAEGRLNVSGGQGITIDTENKVKVNLRDLVENGSGIMWSDGVQPGTIKPDLLVLSRKEDIYAALSTDTNAVGVGAIKGALDDREWKLRQGTGIDFIRGPETHDTLIYVTPDNFLSDRSENSVQNKVITPRITDLEDHREFKLDNRTGIALSRDASTQETMIAIAPDSSLDPNSFNAVTNKCIHGYINDLTVRMIQVETGKQDAITFGSGLSYDSRTHTLIRTVIEVWEPIGKIQALGEIVIGAGTSVSITKDLPFSDTEIPILNSPVNFVYGIPQNMVMGKGQIYYVEQENKYKMDVTVRNLGSSSLTHSPQVCYMAKRKLTI